MPASHKWTFKQRFRAGAYGWKASRLACKRLKQAVREITKVAKTDSVLGAEGAVALMERIWPALEHIDGSSGALGSAVNRTLEELIPLIVEAPADRKTREKWLERLYEAVCEDGVSYLAPVEDRWGDICGCAELANEWADRLLPGLRHLWSADEPGGVLIGTDLCLSCLLAAERYDELREVLSLNSRRLWFHEKFWAEALVRQGCVDEAISHAESMRRDDGYDRWDIQCFCERVLRDAGRREEAYRRYGLHTSQKRTYLGVFRETTEAYPEYEPRKVLLDLIHTRGDLGKWFAAAKDAGHLDIALECASVGTTDPATLTRAARDFCETEPKFGARVALQAIENLLSGRGYEPSPVDMDSAYGYLMRAAAKCGEAEWAAAEVLVLLAQDTQQESIMHRALEARIRRDQR